MSNIFGDLDSEFAGVAPKAPASQELFPTGEYGFVIVPFKEDENATEMVDYATFKAGDTTGIRFMLEFLDPKVAKDAEGNDVEMTGKQVEKVFWATKNNLPYLKNDWSSILQTTLEGKKLSEVLEKTTWAGRTFRGVLVHEKDKRGVMRNSISFITPWAPEAPPADVKKDAGKKDDAKKTTASAGGKATKF